jgi:hypothetical protein
MIDITADTAYAWNAWTLSVFTAWIRQMDLCSSAFFVASKNLAKLSSGNFLLVLFGGKKRGICPILDFIHMGLAQLSHITKNMMSGPKLLDLLGERKRSHWFVDGIIT